MAKVWTQGEGLSTEEVTYDADAILSGEAEEISRRFEEYFGLPSQREPAGHVPGPALLATRINSQAQHSCPEVVSKRHRTTMT